MAENEKVNRLLEEISGLSVLELAELTEAIEDKFGVSGAAAAAPAAAAPAQAEGEAQQEQEEEKAEFNVQLEAFGDKKMDVIKALRKTGKGKDLGLKEAKNLVEDTPVTLFEAVPKDEAQEMKKTLEEAGATIKLA